MELSKERLDIIVALCDGLDGEDMQHLIERLGMEDQMRTQLTEQHIGEFSIPDKRLAHISEDVAAAINYFKQTYESLSKMQVHLDNIDEASDETEDISHWKKLTQ